MRPYDLGVFSIQRRAGGLSGYANLRQTFEQHLGFDLQLIDPNVLQV